jgi:hypothetical protein
MGWRRASLWLGDFPGTAEKAMPPRPWLEHCTLWRSGIDYRSAGKSKRKFPTNSEDLTMKARFGVWANGRVAPRFDAVSAVLLALSCCLLSGCKGPNGQKASNAPVPNASVPYTPAPQAPVPSAPVPSAAGPNTSTPNASGSLDSDLHAIGMKVAAAVVARDVNTLLTYDRADLRAADEKSLENPKDDLYCFLFDSKCDPSGWKSVYEKFSSARELRVKAFIVQSPEDDRAYGTLLFYDHAQIQEKSLESNEFLCKEQPQGIASWKFELTEGKWSPVTPLFDYATEGLCSDEE